jgi:glycosyltransferase involved in cell wall biosynthesis
MNSLDHNVNIIILSDSKVEFDFKINIYKLNFNKNFFHKIQSIFNYISLINKIEPDIIHSHMFHANILTRLVKIFCKNFKHISSVHSNNEGGLFRMLIYRSTNFLSNLITNVSIDAVNTFENKYAVSKGKMKCIYNGIDLITFYNENNKIIDKNKPIFLSVGSLTKLKDFNNLILGFKYLVKYIPEAKLQIAGEGPLKEELSNLIYELNLERNINILGLRRDIPILMKNSDIFVLSSTHEGFGLVIAEAMASGLLIVATDCGGAKEVLGNCGFIVPIKNPYILAEKMNEAVNLNSTLRNILKENSYKRVKDNFDIDTIFNQWLNIYKLINTV